LLDEQQHWVLVVQARGSVDLPRDPNSGTSMVRRQLIDLLAERGRRECMAMQVEGVELWVYLVRRY
jgi:hypothetical protein